MRSQYRRLVGCSPILTKIGQYCPANIVESVAECAKDRSIGNSSLEGKRPTRKRCTGTESQRFLRREPYERQRRPEICRKGWDMSCVLQFCQAKRKPTERPVIAMKAQSIPMFPANQRGRRPSRSTNWAAVTATMRLKIASPPLIPACCPGCVIPMSLRMGAR